MNTSTIGAKITNARKKTTLSQAQLAQQLFISPQAVGKWERGESVPDIITFARLAEVLGVDLNYFSETFPSAAAAPPSEQSTSETSDRSAAGEPARGLAWNMSGGNWVDADFSGLKNLKDQFSSSNMRACLFVGSELSGLLLKANHVEGCDFSDSDISGSRIQHTHLSNNLFGGCSLKGAELSGSHLKDCNFSGADFTGAVLKSVSLQKATMTAAVLKRTAFEATAIQDTVFEGTVEDCSFDNCGFGRVMFQNATLVNTFFKGGKLKGLRFENSHADRMTYEFLKAGKADLTGLTLLSA